MRASSKPGLSPANGKSCLHTDSGGGAKLFAQSLRALWPGKDEAKHLFLHGRKPPLPVRHRSHACLAYLCFALFCRAFWHLSLGSRLVSLAFVALVGVFVAAGFVSVATRFLVRQARETRRLSRGGLSREGRHGKRGREIGGGDLFS